MDFEDLVPPLQPREALSFGVAHTLAVTDQATRGIFRTLPGWFVAGVAVTTADLYLRPTSRHSYLIRAAVEPAIVAAASQLLWIAGFATFSGARTAVRLATQTSESVTPIARDAADGARIIASAHVARSEGSYYIDGVFAWPRGHGGGRAVMARLLARADRDCATLALTALSPSVAALYRKVGFRCVLWIYLMRREPRNWALFPQRCSTSPRR